MKPRKFWVVYTLFLLGSLLLLAPFPGAAQERQEGPDNSCLEKGTLVSEDCPQNLSRIRNCVSLEVSEMIRERTQNRDKTEERLRERDSSQSMEGAGASGSPAGVKAVINFSPEEVEELRSQGLGYGEITIIQLLQERSGKTLEDILSLFKEGKGWGEIASLLGVDFHGIGELVSRERASAKQEKRGLRK